MKDAGQNSAVDGVVTESLKSDPLPKDFRISGRRALFRMGAIYALIGVGIYSFAIGAVIRQRRMALMTAYSQLDAVAELISRQMVKWREERFLDA
ncbi:MAG: hypothetical protein U1E27_09680, partial [Kiritimatiellia bacterium]|nr:hypothetical protein [Kiritimatiellia bacterium]